ncbi:MAG: MBL fold metallo-hydrolase [Clostridiales Family XIII bacterium]|jgi:glyoxylase-like metal-dependent hydrolase (beta-lactamase superfamily II)|nr:MBL fold metallo-hydrolase [Clostridiales Family XIII bacterium]
MFEAINVSGHRGGTSVLITTAKSAFLCDTGLSFSAPDTAKNIKAALGGRGLDYILLTHSHFDHAGGTPIISEAFPEAKIVASEHAAHVFTRSGAREMIRSLDIASAKLDGIEAGEDTTSRLRVDIVAGDGDTLSTQDETIRVYFTPGHTNCSLSYYFEAESLFAVSESSGFMLGDIIWPSFMSSCRDSLASIDLIERLAPDYLLLPHSGLLSGDDAKAYPARIREETLQKSEFILSRHRSGMPENDIVEAFVKEYFDGIIRATGVQTEESFVANAEALVPRLIAESDN